MRQAGQRRLFSGNLPAMFLFQSRCASSALTADVAGNVSKFFISRFSILGASERFSVLVYRLTYRFSNNQIALKILLCVILTTFNKKWSF